VRFFSLGDVATIAGSQTMWLGDVKTLVDGATYGPMHSRLSADTPPKLLD